MVDERTAVRGAYIIVVTTENLKISLYLLHHFICLDAGFIIAEYCEASSFFICADL
jgi:hypothetical protein